MDPEKHSAVSAHAESEDVGSVSKTGEPALDLHVIRKLRLKMDLIILPTLAIMYTFNSLDRSNLGNAITAGLAEDTKLKADEYNLLLTLYYVMFVIFGPVMATFTKICSAKVALPAMMLAFGVASSATAATKNFGGLAACRILVRIFESGFLASVVFYLSKWYTRTEIASRIAIFYSGAVIASAFGGLIAYGMFQITPSAYFILPQDISRAYFLSAAEKEMAETRIRLESLENRNDKWVWSEAISEFKTVHGWARIVIGMAVGILPNASANFLAIMTVRLSYSVTKTNLYTVAHAATAAAFLLVLSYSSDRFRERGFHMIVPLGLSIVGYAILLSVDVETQKGIGYGAILFCTIGAYPMSVIFSAWTVSNIPNLNARAFTTGVMLACLNSMGLVASNIFLTEEAPRYGTALIVNMAFPCVAIVVTAMYSLYLRRLNHGLDKRERMSGLTNLAEGQGSFRYQT
ncbi:hypothetical protein LTR17_013098 [Elasticomyces elasticus]|nr:hypothetical protein LTR17_013098 [Elasticomyces elasticus]